MFVSSRQPLSQIALHTNAISNSCQSRVFEFLEEDENEDESDKERQLSDVNGEATL